MSRGSQNAPRMPANRFVSAANLLARWKSRAERVVIRASRTTHHREHDLGECRRVATRERDRECIGDERRIVAEHAGAPRAEDEAIEIVMRRDREDEFGAPAQCGLERDRIEPLLLAERARIRRRARDHRCQHRSREPATIVVAKHRHVWRVDREIEIERRLARAIASVVIGLLEQTRIQRRRARERFFLRLRAPEENSAIALEI